jgi:hypothetical protein
MTKDQEHLKLLAIFHYVLAGCSTCFSSMFLMHFFWGLAVLTGSPFLGPAEKNPPPAPMGIVLMLIGGGIVLMGWSFAACLVFAGRSLTQQRRYVFCFTVAVLMCVFCNPLGTVLGVFTIITLMRPTVKELFGVEQARP